jgi:hypothetical protein
LLNNILCILQPFGRWRKIKETTIYGQNLNTYIKITFIVKMSIKCKEKGENFTKMPGFQLKRLAHNKLEERSGHT